MKELKHTVFFILSFLLSLAISEVETSGFMHHKHAHSIGSVHGIFSLGSRQVLNWYSNGIPIKSSNSRYSIVADGLNTVLSIKGKFDEVYGIYSLKIEGTNIYADTIFVAGIATI